MLLLSPRAPQIRLPLTVTAAPRPPSVPAAAASPPAVALDSDRSLWDPPEVISGGAATTAADVFAFGIILVEIFTRRPPFQEELQQQPLAAVLEAVVEADLRPSLPQAFPKELHDIAADCWHRNRSRRPSFAEVGSLLAAAFEVLRPAMLGTGYYDREAREMHRAIVRAAADELAQMGDEDEILRFGSAVIARLVPDAQVVAVAALADAQQPPAAAAATSERNNTPPPAAGCPHESKLVVQAADASADAAITDILETALRTHATQQAQQQQVNKRGSAATSGPHHLGGGPSELGPLPGAAAAGGFTRRVGGSLSSRGTSLAWLLAHNRHQPVASSTAPRGLSSFEDWVEADRRLPPPAEDQLRLAWSALLRADGAGGGTAAGAAAAARSLYAEEELSGAASGSSSSVTGFVLVVYNAPAPRSPADGEEAVLSDFAAVLGRSLHRSRTQAENLARQREQDTQRLQQRFLQNVRRPRFRL